MPRAGYVVIFLYRDKSLKPFSRLGVILAIPAYSIIKTLTKHKVK